MTTCLDALPLLFVPFVLFVLVLGTPPAGTAPLPPPLLQEVAEKDLVAWIIPKDALSSCFSTQGIT